MISAVLLSLVLSSTAHAYDCSNSKPFDPIAYQTVRIYVGHFYWKTNSNGTREEVVEDVCSTQDPLDIPLLDIRNREEEWFYCYPGLPTFSCSTTYLGAPASIEIKPAIVIRQWSGGYALDTHFHAYVTPDRDPTRYFDLFARSLRQSLSPQPITLDAAGGGRGENSGIDSFYVRADFK